MDAGKPRLSLFGRANCGGRIKLSTTQSGSVTGRGPVDTTHAARLLEEVRRRGEDSDFQKTLDRMSREVYGIFGELPGGCRYWWSELELKR